MGRFDGRFRGRFSGRFSQVSAAAVSTAATMLASETQGLAIDFTDTFWQPSTGHYGSAKVKDTGTPANNYDSNPYGLLTNAGTLKLTRQSDGVYRFQAHNAVLQSEDLSNASWSKTACTVSGAGKIIPNSGSGTSIVFQAVTTVDATLSVKCKAAEFSKILIACVVGGSNYGYGFDLSNGTMSSVGTITSTPTNSISGPDSDGYYTCSISVATGTTTTQARIIPLANFAGTGVTGNGSDGVFAKTVHYRRNPCSSAYLATTTAARYALPFEWNTGGVLQGVLMELQATNLFLNSTVGATQTVTVSNATAYTVSFFGTGSITFSGANSSTLSGTGATDRVSTTFTTSSTSLTCTVSGSISYVQVETGSFATSPIITYGASATRTGDLLSLATSLFPYSNGCAMTLFARLELPNGVSTYPLVFSSGTLGLRRLNTNIPRLDNFIGGSGTITYGSSITGTYSHAAATASGDQALCINGGTVSTNSFVYAHTGLTQLNIGALAANNAAVSGYVKKVMWWPRRAANAELQTMSS